MRGLTVRAASAFDMLETLGDDGGRVRLTRQRFGEMARQVSEGRAVTIREADGALVAVIGLWPEAAHDEAWFGIGLAFRRRIRTALAIMEAALDAEGRPEVRVYVRPGPRVAGARLASWLGFETAGMVGSPIGPVEMFVRRSGAAEP